MRADGVEDNLVRWTNRDASPSADRAVGSTLDVVRRTEAQMPALARAQTRSQDKNQSQRENILSLKQILQHLALFAKVTLRLGSSLRGRIYAGSN